MPDISKCNNAQCPLNDTCWRYTCIPNEFNQSWNRYEPREVKKLTKVGFTVIVTECDAYIEDKLKDHNGESIDV